MNEEEFKKLSEDEQLKIAETIFTRIDLESKKHELELEKDFYKRANEKLEKKN